MPFSINHSTAKLAVTLLLFAIFGHATAQQNNIRFSPLSADCYIDKIAKIKSYKVPKFYTEKSPQAWYEEIVAGRNKALLTEFEDNKIIKDSLLLDKCNEVLKKIIAANRNFKFDTIQLYINRSVIANAACYGEGTVMINLGLFLWIDNDDELALVIGHEIAHQLLNHSDSKIQKTIAMLTSDEFTSELKKIKKADYGKFDRYRKLMKDINVESGRHSSYKESEADSLGIILIKNAGYNTNNAARVLLKLDKVEELFKSDKLYTTKDLFSKTTIDQSYFTIKPKYNGLSSMKVTMNADKDMDSIKTHPDCAIRYAAISGNVAAPVNCCIALNSNYKIFKERAMLELVRFQYENNNLGLCAHLCFFALQNQYDASTYDHFLSLCFSKLFYKDKKLERFNAANAYASAGSNLKELQDFLFQAGTEDLEKLAVYFLNTNGGNNNTEDYDFANLMYQTQVKMKEEEPLYNYFKSRHPNSKYIYLIQKK
jgi:Zn-dependent protease with chaperone function